MRSSYITAIVIGVAVTVWLASGQWNGAGSGADQPSLAELKTQQHAMVADQAPTRVRVRVIRAEPQTANILVRGRTENKRTVAVKAETSGRIERRAVERGSQVSAGALLCRIATDDRSAKLHESREALNQARIEYDGFTKLVKRGLQSETLMATARAKLASAKANLTHSELELARTEIRAPFAGLVEDTHVEIGDYVQPGMPCATVIDLDPMLLVGRVAERDVHKLQVGGAATGRLIDGTEVSGKLSFIGKQSDSATRTYPVEIAVPNPQYALRSGITTEIEIPIETLSAHRISPALLALDDNGEVGVRTLDDDNRVVFNPVEILADEAGAVWVAGLPEVATLITVGQELVIPGEQVEVSVEAGSLERESDRATAQQPEAEEASGEAVAETPSVGDSITVAARAANGAS